MHAIGQPNGDPIWLCDQHFHQVNEAGLVAEPYIAEADYQEREQQRSAQTQPKRNGWFSRRLTRTRPRQ